MMARTIVCVLTLPLALGACNDSLTSPAEDPGAFTALEAGSAVSRMPAHARGARVSHATVQRFSDGAGVGSSMVRRGNGGVVLQLHTDDVPAGHAATLWVVVFNNPEACIGECDDPDLFENPATRADLLYAAGDVANAQGRVNYHAAIATGAAGASIMPLFGLPAYGIEDTDRAEIHLVLRDHGPRLPGLETAQTTTFNGGCQGFGPEFGTPGPNACVDSHFASHYAPAQ